MSGLTEEIQGFFSEIRETNQEIKRLLTNPDPNAETANLAEVLTRLDNTLGSINREIRTQSPEVDRFLRNLSAISDDIKEITATLKKHPSGLIFNLPPSKSEIIK